MALHPENSLNVISLCTGGGGLDLGVELAIPCARPVVLVEREAFAVARLVSAMEDGLMAPAPVWSDVRTFNGRPWRGLVDGVIGGIPCQPHSVAGRRLGADDERDLWADARRIIVQSGVWWCLIENVAGMLSTGGFERVWRDLRRLGFEVEAGLFTSAEVGAPHERTRVFILAMADPDRRLAPRRCSGCDETSGGRSRGKLAGSSKELAVAGCERDAGRRDSRDVFRSTRTCETDQEKRKRHGDAVGHGYTNMENTDCAGLEGRTGGELRERAGEWAARAAGRAMEPTASNGWRERRSEPVVRSGRDATAGDGGTVANADEPVFCRQPSAGELAVVQCDDGYGRENFAMVHAIGGGHNGIAPDALGQPIGRTVAERTERSSLPIFPPGPADLDAWRDIIERAPHLEPAVRRVADELAGRVDQLRMLGNGVNPLQAAYAVRTLATRLARRSAAAVRIVRMMDLAEQKSSGRLLDGEEHNEIPGDEP